jgi:hypothetical protein
MIIDHEQLGLELLLFYREKKNQYPGYAFRYEGRFVYVSHAGKQPAHFILGREAARHPIPLPPAAPSLPLPQAEPTPPVVTPPLEAPTRSPQAILAAGMQTFIQHMQAHGMAHEREVTAMFEHPRHYRRFVDVFDQAQQDWPFRVRIEMLSGVKVYKKDAHR